MNLEDVIPLTNQAFFDAGLAQCRKQEQRSMKLGLCAYRGEDDTACFVGASIPDSIYRPWMDGHGMSATALLHAAKFQQHEMGAALLKLFSGVSRDLMMTGQQLHDNRLDKDDMVWFEDGAAELAVTFNLTYTAP